MPGLAALSGIGPLIEFGGRHVQVHGRRLRHMAEIEDMVIWNRGEDPVDTARKLLSHWPEDSRSGIAIQLLKQVRHNFAGATHSEMSRWLSTFEGRVFAIWQAVRENHVDYEDVARIVSNYWDQGRQDYIEKIEWAIEIASGHSEYQSLLEIRALHPINPSTGEAAKFPNYDSLFRSMSREPFCMRPCDVMDLTLYQFSLIARSSEQSASDERDAESSQIKMTQLPLHMRQVLWENPYRPLADNVAQGRHISSGLTS